MQAATFPSLESCNSLLTASTFPISNLLLFIQQGVNTTSWKWKSNHSIQWLLLGATWCFRLAVRTLCAQFPAYLYNVICSPKFPLLSVLQTHRPSFISSSGLHSSFQARLHTLFPLFRKALRSPSMHPSHDLNTMLLGVAG